MLNSTQGIYWVPNLFAYVSRTIFSQHSKNSASLKILQKTKSRSAAVFDTMVSQV